MTGGLKWVEWNGRCDVCGSDKDDFVAKGDRDTHTEPCPFDGCGGTLKPFNFTQSSYIPGINDPRGKRKDELEKYKRENS